MLMRCASSLVLLPLAGVLMLGGCDRSASDVAAPTVTTRPADPAASSETGGIQSWKPSRDPRIASFLGLETTKPVMWIEHPPLGADRITQFTIPGVPPAEAAHLIVFHFDETGGGPLDLNIRRWEAQFRRDGMSPVPADLERFNVGDFTVTLIELEGEFMPSHAVEFRPNQALTIAAFQSPEVTFMLRLVGDAATVRAARPAFMEMVQDVHPVVDRAE